MIDWVAAVPYIAAVAKVLLAIVIGLQVAPLMVWLERRQGALIQRRIGPNRVGLFGFRLLGLGQPLADTVKLLFKEDVIPTNVERFFFIVAPVITAVTGLVALACLPFGAYVEVLGHSISLQPIELNAGFLIIFAISSLGVYGVALAGWSSNNKYSLLGGLRASAQMVSYEIGMGLSMLPIVFIFGTLDLQKIIYAQSHDPLLFGFLPAWGVFYAPVSFIIFVITMFAETNRVPFDLAEGEAELVGGFLTEYGSMRWSLFFLGEYAMMFTLSALTVCLFLGGYELPWLSHTELVAMLSSYMTRELALWAAFAIGFGVLIGKVVLFMILFVQARFTLPRFRYDQLMHVGWAVILPIALINLVITVVVTAVQRFGIAGF
jgi:NADH-quinone oxidoreductase subunit H